MDIREIAGLAGAPLVQALTELIKVMFPLMESRWYPAISVFWGVVLNIALAFILNTGKPEACIVGVATGLLASGLFSWGKRTETTGRR